MIAAALAWLSSLVGSLGIGLTLGGTGGILATVAALFAGMFFKRALFFGGIGGLAMLLAFTGGYSKGNKDCNKNYELALANARIVELQRQQEALNSTLKRQNEIEQQYIKDRDEDEQRIAELNRIIATTTPVQRNCPRAATADELRAIKRIGEGEDR